MGCTLLPHTLGWCTWLASLLLGLCGSQDWACGLASLHTFLLWPRTRHDHHVHARANSHTHGFGSRPQMVDQPWTWVVSLGFLDDPKGHALTLSEASWVGCFEGPCGHRSLLVSRTHPTQSRLFQTRSLYLDGSCFLSRLWHYFLGWTLFRILASCFSRILIVICWIDF